MEVFGIIYLGRNELKPADQIGTIKVSDGYTVACPLYKVIKKEQAKTPSICCGDELILNGPKWSFVGCESFYIEVDLFNSSFKDTISFEWDSRSDFLYHKKKLLSEDGTGELLVLYGLFASASQARVCVRLINPGGGVVDVYGVIYANTNRCEHPMFTTMLFSATGLNKKSGTWENNSLVQTHCSRVVDF